MRIRHWSVAANKSLCYVIAMAKWLMARRTLPITTENRHKVTRMYSASLLAALVGGRSNKMTQLPRHEMVARSIIIIVTVWYKHSGKY